jgi:hypothetical protein
MKTTRVEVWNSLMARSRTTGSRGRPTMDVDESIRLIQIPHPWVCIVVMDMPLRLMDFAIGAISGLPVHKLMQTIVKILFEFHEITVLR